MTCIVAIRDGRSVYMGADSISANDEIKHLCKNPKLYQCGPVMIGSAGSWRGMNFLENFKPPPLQPKQDARAYMIEAFTPKLVAAMRDGHAVHKEDEVEKLENSYFLAVCKRRIFYVQGDLSVVETREKYAAIGAGYQFARGSFHSTAGTWGYQRVRLALEAAAHHSPFVAPPFDIRECL